MHLSNAYVDAEMGLLAQHRLLQRDLCVGVVGTIAIGCLMALVVTRLPFLLTGRGLGISARPALRSYIPA